MRLAAEPHRAGEAQRGEEDRGVIDRRSGFPRLLRRSRLYWFPAILVVLLGAYLASGFYTVGADERAVVRRFGAVDGRVGPGMHYRLPWPVDRVDVVKTTSVMKVGVGFALSTGDSEAPSGMELLTGDTNILNAALVLQYVIRDPAEFLFDVENTQAFVEAVAEGVLTETVLARRFLGAHCTRPG
jgi:modulator of FtsH protease HflK